MAKKIEPNQLNSGIEPTVPSSGTRSFSNPGGVSSFPIVGIGASAGGLEALEQFFGHIPDKSGIAFVVIQHLDPTRVGIMPELLQRITPLKVMQASDGLTVEPDFVYVIPPNKSLSLSSGALHLADPVETRGLRLPIDIFFRSLADDQEEKSIGVILSGMGSDGSLGLKSIKEKGGVVLVQDPTTAKFDGMPSSAIQSVLPDIVAPAEDLPQKLIAFLNFSPETALDTGKEKMVRSSIERIIILLHQRTGHDFSQYRKTTIFRRVERRQVVHQLEKISLYVNFLQDNPTEIDILFRELLIGVTSFFRDAAVWDLLREKVLPTLLKGLPDGYTVRAWVPGCSRGEEAYTLAICFKEAMEKLSQRKLLNLQIFATDIDQTAIEMARKGVFPKSIAEDVSPERLARFFVHENQGYRVNTNIREMVVFAPQNVIKDPPFTKLDILSFRNVLIYMESELQRKLIALFNYSLNPGGLLILGTAETPGSQMDGFKDIDPKLKIYSKSGTSQVSELFDFPSSFHRKVYTPEKYKLVNPVENIQTIAEQVLLQHFTPPSVLVNENGDILYISGRTGKFLEPVAGKANWNIHAMARDGLRQVLLGAFRKASANYDPLVLKSIKIGSNGDSQFVDVTVQRIENSNTARMLILVVFKTVPLLIEPGISNTKIGKAAVNNRIAELESELQRSYEERQSTREEMQTSQEELKSTNEEWQSTNEELQSTNEELTTSKEEMQSLNEELQTVNAELQSKVTDYIQASDDMKNLLNSTGIATLFLDKDLNIRRFTDQVAKIVKLRDADIARPITDLVTDLDYPDLHENARKVIKSLTFIETAHSTHDGRWFNVRIMPYRTLDDRIDGLVLTFTEITEAKRLEAELKQSEQIFREMIEKSPDACFINDFSGGKDCGIIDGNKAVLQLFGMNSKTQLLATQTNSLSPEQQPDGKFSNAKYTEMIAKALVNGSNRFDWVYKKLDGKLIYGEVNMTVIDSLGKKLLHTFIKEIPQTT